MRPVAQTIGSVAISGHWRDDPDQPRLRLHMHEAAGRWGSVPVVGLEAKPALGALGVPLAKVYEGLGFRDGPRGAEG